MLSLNKFMELIAPKHCLWCQMRTHSHLTLCDECIHKLSYNTHSCRNCAIPIEQSNTTQCCHNCLRRPWPFNNIMVPLLYHPPISYFITELKFKHRLSHSKLMGELLLQAIDPSKIPALLIPVPLHAKRLRSRGFNQALEISKVINQHLHIPIDTTSIQRIKNTKPQSLLSKKERRGNLNNAFVIKKEIQQKHLVLIDDVLTTGQTVNELYKILNKNNHYTIDLWCCARAHAYS